MTTKTAARRDSLMAQWSDLGPQNRHTLPRTLWGVSHYFDEGTLSWFGARVLDGYAYETRAHGERSLLVVAREASRDFGHRVVIIVSIPGKHSATHRIECRNARHSAEVYNATLTALCPMGWKCRKQGWTARALFAHVEALEHGSHASRVIAVSEARA